MLPITVAPPRIIEMTSNPACSVLFPFDAAVRAVRAVQSTVCPSQCIHPQCIPSAVKQDKDRCEGGRSGERGTSVSKRRILRVCVWMK